LLNWPARQLTSLCVLLDGAAFQQREVHLQLLASLVAEGAPNGGLLLGGEQARRVRPRDALVASKRSSALRTVGRLKVGDDLHPVLQSHARLREQLLKSSAFAVHVALDVQHCDRTRRPSTCCADFRSTSGDGQWQARHRLEARRTSPSPLRAEPGRHQRLRDVLGTAFDACYNPIKDAGGQIIGASYIGHKK
jgi:transposase